MSTLPRAESIFIGSNGTVVVYFHSLPEPCLPALSTELAKLSSDSTIHPHLNRVSVFEDNPQTLHTLNQLFRPRNPLTAQVAYVEPNKPPSVADAQYILTFPFRPDFGVLDSLAMSIRVMLNAPDSVKLSKGDEDCPPTITLHGLVAWRVYGDEQRFRRKLRILNVVI